MFSSLIIWWSLLYLNDSKSIYSDLYTDKYDGNCFSDSDGFRIMSHLITDFFIFSRKREISGVIESPGEMIGSIIGLGSAGMAQVPTEKTLL